MISKELKELYCMKMEMLELYGATLDSAIKCINSGRYELAELLYAQAENCNGNLKNINELIEVQKSLDNVKMTLNL